MSAPSPRPPHPFRLRWQFLLHRRVLGPRTVLSGYHNHNVVVPLRAPLASMAGRPPGEKATFRTPRARPLRVIPRLWQDEGAVLEAVRRRLPHVPVPLLASGRTALRSYVPGTTLAELTPAPRPVGEPALRDIAEMFGALGDIRRADLPPLPADWPEDGDTGGFLRALVEFARTEVYEPNLPRFGTLFHDLGIPADAMERFHASTAPLDERPFRLLHTDVHRANLVRLPAEKDDEGPLALLDWENALYGDPLHELATHLVRMGYRDEEWDRSKELWGKHCGSGGTKKDLDVYVDFEYAQSVYPDTMRAALALPGRPEDGDFAAAGERVRTALRRASAPLALQSVPDATEVEAALRAWHATDRRPATPRSAFRRRSVRGHRATG